MRHMTSINLTGPDDPRVVACRIAKHIFGPGELAAKIGRGIGRQAITMWTVVPPEHVLAVEAATNISRHELRPDIFGPLPVRKTRPRNGEAQAAAESEAESQGT